MRWKGNDQRGRLLAPGHTLRRILQLERSSMELSDQLAGATSDAAAARAQLAALEQAAGTTATAAGPCVGGLHPIREEGEEGEEEDGWGGEASPAPAGRSVQVRVPAVPGLFLEAGAQEGAFAEQAAALEAAQAEVSRLTVALENAVTAKAAVDVQLAASKAEAEALLAAAGTETAELRARVEQLAGEAAAAAARTQQLEAALAAVSESGSREAGEVARQLAQVTAQLAAEADTRAGLEVALKVGGSVNMGASLKFFRCLHAACGDAWVIWFFNGCDA